MHTALLIGPTSYSMISSFFPYFVRIRLSKVSVKTITNQNNLKKEINK